MFVARHARTNADRGRLGRGGMRERLEYFGVFKIGEIQLGAFEAGDIPTFRRRYGQHSVGARRFVECGVDGGLDVVENQWKMNAIFEYARMRGLDDSGKPLQFLAIEDPAGRIPRIAQDVQLGARLECPLDSFVVQSPLIAVED